MNIFEISSFFVPETGGFGNILVRISTFPGAKRQGGLNFCLSDPGGGVLFRGDKTPRSCLVDIANKSCGVVIKFLQPLSSWTKKN